MVEALCYKWEGRGFSPDEVIESFFYLPNHSSRTMALGFTQPPKQKHFISTFHLISFQQKCVPEDLSGGKARPARKTDNLTAIREQTVY
jgi:hypothetical protein